MHFGQSWAETKEVLWLAQSGVVVSGNSLFDHAINSRITVRPEFLDFCNISPPKVCNNSTKIFSTSTNTCEGAGIYARISELSIEQICSRKETIEYAVCNREKH